MIGLAAPGQRIYAPTVHTQTNNIFGLTVPGYTLFGETSGATAMVSGVAGMVSTVAGGSWRGATGQIAPATIKQILTGSADSISEKGNTFIEIPVTVAAVAAVAAPVLAAVGTIAALVAHFTIVVVRSKQASAGEEKKESSDRG